MNKEIKRYKQLINVLIFGMIVFLIIAGVSLFFYTKQKIENRQLKEGFVDFMGYMLNVTKYCAESNNITYDELLEGYLESEMDKILEDFANSGGNE